MWWQQALLAVLGLSAGFAVAGGIFALIIALGVVARFAGRTHTARYIFLYEDAVALGGIFGNLMSVYGFSLPIGQVGAGIFGLFSGIFVGAWAMALAEIVDVFPIFSRRLGLKRSFGLMIAVLALGRSIGSLLHFYYRWG